MKILVINGAPRENGYTKDLLELFNSGAVAAGGLVEQIDLRNYDVRPCTGCFHCWDPSRAGKCSQSDDMAMLTEKFLDSDVLVLATPVYYYSFSALIKAFLERLLPTSLPIITQGGEIGLERNTERYPDRGPDRAALIAVGAHRNPKIMDGLVKTFELICDGIYAKPVGKLLRTESFFLDFDAGKPITGRKVRMAFERAGAELVREGWIEAQTESDASLPFTRDLETFRRNSGTYWKIAREIGAGGNDREQLRAAVSRDLRILAHELAACYDPVAAGDLEAVILFDFRDEDADNWHLTIDKGRCAASEGTHPSPTLTLETTEEILVEIILQRLDARTALARGDLKATGSKSLLGRFQRIFPPPST